MPIASNVRVDRKQFEHARQYALPGLNHEIQVYSNFDTVNYRFGHFGFLKSLHVIPDHWSMLIAAPEQPLSISTVNSICSV